jgi:catechol 2,3-dioxygenase-like lactoylglutathione lyase family enzyme
MGYRFTQKTNKIFDIRGLSHVALVCADMKRTVAFYQGVLGFPLVKTVDLPGNNGQHFFFDMGDGNSSLAFFHFPNPRVVAPGVTVPKSRLGDPNTTFDPSMYTTAIGSMHHLAFRVAAEKIPEYQKKLENLGIWVSPIMYHFGEAGDEDRQTIGVAPDEECWLTSIYFRDPDGITLEFGGWGRELKDADAGLEPASNADAPPAVAQLAVEQLTGRR